MPHPLLRQITFSGSLRFSHSRGKALFVVLLSCCIIVEEQTSAGNRMTSSKFLPEAISSRTDVFELPALLYIAAHQQEDKRTRAMMDIAEANGLYNKKTPESLQAAIAKLQEAGLLFHELKDNFSEAACFYALGEIYEFKRDWHLALEHDQKALVLFRALQNPIGEQFKREALNKIGRIYVNGLGELYKGLEAYQEVLSSSHAAQDRKAEALAMKDIGLIYVALGMAERALEKFQEARLIFRELADHSNEVMILVLIGVTSSQSGSKKKALEALQNALVTQQTMVKDSPDEAVIRLLIASVYIDLGESQKALEKYQEARSSFIKAGNRPGEVIASNNIGLALFNRGESQKALEEFQKALSVLSIPVKGEEGYKALVLGNMGYVYSNLGEKQKALEYYHRALLLFQIIEDDEGEPAIHAWRNLAASIFSNLMILWTELGNHRLAVFYGKQAVNKYQQIRAILRSFDEEQQRAFVRPKEETYRKLAELLIKQGRLSEAHQVLNLFKDQEYFDLMSQRQLALKPDARIVFTNFESNAGQRFRQAAREAFEDKRGQQPAGQQSSKREPQAMQPPPLGDDAGRVARYNEAAKGPQARFNVATDQYLEAIQKIEKDYPELPAADGKLEKPSDTAELQLSLQVLSRQTGLKTAALYTLIGEKYFYTVLITPDSIKSFSVPIAAEALNHKVINLFSLLQSADYDPRLQSKELYDIILKPVEAELKTANIQTLMWSPDGALRYIPMAALYDGQQYLVERFNHVVLTRAEKGRLTRAVNAHWTGYGFATSAPHKVEVGGQPITFGPLDFAEDEMQIFRTTARPKGLIDGEIFPEAKFNKASLLAALKQKRPLVHISSHFRFRPGDEANSFLLLGDNTVMTLTEMKGHPDLFQGVELLTLSACDTAAQRPDATGKEIDAFAELAQRLGAGSVMASLWSVRDRSTAQLMKAFYKNREGGKATKAEALRKAQLDLLHGNGSNPATVVNRGSEKSLRGSSRNEDIIVEAKYRVPFKPDKSRPFAHPYYWSPFVLFGNWR